jgi:hypothetical protein
MVARRGLKRLFLGCKQVVLDNLVVAAFGGFWGLYLQPKNNQNPYIKGTKKGTIQLLEHTIY